jgi:hypothetical protein
LFQDASVFQKVSNIAEQVMSQDELQRINFASAGATALGLYSILKQYLNERVFALLFAEYSKKQWHITLI